MECAALSFPHGAQWTSGCHAGFTIPPTLDQTVLFANVESAFPLVPAPDGAAARSTYSPPAFCGSRDNKARRFRLRIKRWR